MGACLSPHLSKNRGVKRSSESRMEKPAQTRAGAKNLSRFLGGLSGNRKSQTRSFILNEILREFSSIFPRCGEY